MSREWAARRFAVAAAALSAAAAALVGLALLAGTSPLDAVRALAEGAAGSRTALGETLARATALVLTAVGASLAFRAGVLNIGLEGQFLAGAVAAAAVGPLLAGSPLAARAGLLAAAALAGALWVMPAAYLEARRGAPEVLSTILLPLRAAAGGRGGARPAPRPPAAARFRGLGSARGPRGRPRGAGRDGPPLRSLHGGCRLHRDRRGAPR